MRKAKPVTMELYITNLPPKWKKSLVSDKGMLYNYTFQNRNAFITILTFFFIYVSIGFTVITECIGRSHYPKINPELLHL